MPKKTPGRLAPRGERVAFLGVVVRLSAGRTYFFDLALVERLAVFRAVVFFLAAVLLGGPLGGSLLRSLFLWQLPFPWLLKCGVSTFSIMALPRGRPG